MARSGETSEVWLKTGNEDYRSGWIRARIQWTPVCDEPVLKPNPFLEPYSKGWGLITEQI